MRDFILMVGGMALLALGVSGIFSHRASAAPAHVMDCRTSAAQQGVLVRRATDGKVVRVDVCGAADSSDDSFRSDVQ